MPDKMHDRVKRMIVENLRLKLKPEEIGNDTPLFETLGLDSIDGLELVVGMEKEFGVSVTSDDVDRQIFRSVNSIVEYIQANAKAK